MAPKMRKRASVGVIDEKFLNTRKQASKRNNQDDHAFQEVTLSAARNKALQRLGASEDGTSNVKAGLDKDSKRNIFPEKFNDPEVEDEYVATAYLMHRPFLVWSMLLFTLWYIIFAIVAVVYDINLPEGLAPAAPDMLGAVIARSCGAIMSLVVALAVLCHALSPWLAQHMSGFTLVVLWAMPNVAQRLRGYLKESPEQLLIYLLCYTVLTPCFQMRYIAGLCWGLMTIQVLLVYAYMHACLQEYIQ